METQLKEIQDKKRQWEIEHFKSDKASEIIELNIGGTHRVATSRSTLTKYCNSLLASLFRSDIKLTKYKGSYFIDRDGVAFTSMITYLSTCLMRKWKSASIPISRYGKKI